MIVNRLFLFFTGSLRYDYVFFKFFLKHIKIPNHCNAKSIHFSFNRNVIRIFIYRYDIQYWDL